MNRLNDFTFLAKLEHEQGSRLRKILRIDVNRFYRDARLMLSDLLQIQIHYVGPTLRPMRSRTKFHVKLKISLTNFI